MLNCQKHLFSLPDSVSYLNCAYMSPLMKSVEAIGQKTVSMKSHPYLIQTEDFFTTVHALKEAFARLIGASNPQRIALIPAVSYGISTAARNTDLKKGQKILMVAEQFPSNYYPWKKLADERGGQVELVPPPAEGSRTRAWNEALIQAIDVQTKVVSIGNVHWADGTLFDLTAIRKRTREVGALLVIDGTQSVGALPIDVDSLQPDALICAGYKFLMGPYSLGLAYFGPYFDQGTPLEENWINRLDSEDFQHLVNYQEAYQPFAGRYSVGEQSNFVLNPMLLTAIKQLLDWQPTRIQAYVKNISDEPLKILAEMGAQVEDTQWRCGHLFGIRLNDHFDENKLSAALMEKQVYVSRRGNAVRVAPHVYNSEEDLEKLVSCFKVARKVQSHFF